MNKPLVYFAIAFASLSLASCANKTTKLEFSQSEYIVNTGDTVTVKKTSGVTYSFIGETPSALTLNEKTGLITFDRTVDNYTQVLYKATKGKVTSEPVVLTLAQDYSDISLEFLNPISYLSNGDYVLAKCNLPVSITYGLVGESTGVSIDRSSGKVSFTSKVKDNQEFTVEISSHGVRETRKFIAALTSLAKPVLDTQTVELNGTIPVSYQIDFSDVDSTKFEKTVNGLILGTTLIDSKYYVYNQETQVVSILSDFTNGLTVGEHKLSIITSRNIVSVNLIVATKFIKSPRDLASINDSPAALSGYYILSNDIDLTSYLAPGGEGYDSGKGWKPIGTYHDVLDGTSYNDAFNGTFEGNGYTISGVYINRTDEYGFNAGLFGYCYSLTNIRNLGVIYSDATSTVRSYSGGFAGCLSSGTITNCWVKSNINCNYGEHNYKNNGGFIGQNLGVISNCYSIGSVDGEDNVGAFCGYNEGAIINSYSLTSMNEKFTNGIPGENCEMFADEEVFKSSASTLNLPAKNWNLVDGQLPSLKRAITYAFPYGIQILQEQEDYNRGDLIDLRVMILPNDFAVEYESQIIVETNDSTYTSNSLIINTSDISVNRLDVTVKLIINGITLSDSTSFNIYEVPTEIVIGEKMPISVEAGNRYILDYKVEPFGANQKVNWSFERSFVIGASIEGNVLTLNNNFENYEATSLVMNATGYGITKQISIPINRPSNLESANYALYSDDQHDIQINIPADKNLQNAKLYMNGEEVNFVTSNNTITISNSLIASIKDTDIAFKLKLTTGEFYNFTVTNYSHKKMTKADLPSDAVAITSKEQFFDLFNMKDRKASRFGNYNKTYYLDADIDFGGEKVTSIGYNNEGGTSHPFEGKLYGFGHKISNISISDNEIYYTLASESAKQDNYRKSLYVVGFFGVLNGIVKDIIFDNININANSYVGGLAGEIGANGEVENVHFINSVVKNANGNCYTNGELKAGKIACINNGKIIGCTFNKTFSCLVG